MTQQALDEPKSLRDSTEKEKRLARLSDPHISSLTEFVKAIRKEKRLNEEIPYFDPSDGGTKAKCLFLFEAPGSQAVKSGFISRNNPDESAKNFFNWNKEAGLPRELTISWNIVPWYIGTGNKIRSAKNDDIEDGKKYLISLLSLLPHLKIIVLCGRHAQKAEAFIKENSPLLTIIKTWHPSPQCVNRYPEKKIEIYKSLQVIRRQLL